MRTVSKVRVNNGGVDDEDFLKGITDCILTQVVNDSTFGADCIGGNVLDLVFISDPERLVELRDEHPLGHRRKGHAVFSWIFGF